MEPQNIDFELLGKTQYLIIKQKLASEDITIDESEQQEGMCPPEQKQFRQKIKEVVKQKLVEDTSQILKLLMTKELKINENLIKQIDNLQNPQRLNHCEAPIYNIILSLFSLYCADKGIKESQKEMILKLISKFDNFERSVEATLKTLSFDLEDKLVDGLKDYLKEGLIGQILRQQIQGNQNYWNLQIKGAFFYFLTLIKGILIKLDNANLKDFQVHKILDKVEQEIQKQNVVNHFFSDYDVKFWSRLPQAFLLYQKQQDKYNEPTGEPDCALLPPFKSEEKIGLLGDWGTSLRDAFDLLDYLVKEKKCSCVLHLGDVYYAGFDHQFKKISDHLQQLRKEGYKFRYYTVPGNHDYYTKGGPFLKHLTLVNENPKDEQKHSFFCLRDEGNNVQFLGVDTGKNEHSIKTHFDKFFTGCHLQDKQFEWAKKRVNQFPGQTIMISHHPLFSVYDPILGRQTKFGKKNQQVDVRFFRQVHEIVPKISCWFWGHEHRCAKYIDWAYGVPRARMVGNSSFQIDTKGVKTQYNAYQPHFRKINIVDSSFEPKIGNNGFYNHTATVFSLEGARVKAEYIQMTSTYMEPAQFDREFSEYFEKVPLEDIRTNEGYFIKESSGLSLKMYTELQGSLIQLDAEPSTLVFQACSGNQEHVNTNSDYIIKILNDKKPELVKCLSIENNALIAASNIPENRENFIWRVVNQSENLKIGDCFQLMHKNSNCQLFLQFNASKRNLYNMKAEKHTQVCSNRQQCIFQVYPKPEFIQQ